MLKKIFEMRNEIDPEYEPPSKDWIARVIGGSIIADGIVHPNEHVYLESLFQMMLDEPKALMTIREVIQAGVMPSVEPIQTCPQLADYIFKCVLDVCACDNEISPSEIQYINEVAMALEIETLRAHKLINTTLRRVKIEFFNQILSQIHGDERLWLASIVLKCILADGRVDSSEIPYLNDVYELVGEQSDVLNKIKQEAKSSSLANLPSVYFDKELSIDIMRYILEIVMGDDDLDEREETMVRNIANILDLDEEQLSALMDKVEQINFFLRASAELMD